MDKPKGGRGYPAPYSTKQMRVPVGLEPQIQELITRYRNWISDAGVGVQGSDNPPPLLDKAVDKLSAKAEVKPVDSFVELEQMEAEIALLLQQNSEFNKLVDNFELEIESLNKVVDRFTKELEDVSIELDRKNQQCNELDEECNSLRVKNDDLNLEIAKLQERLEQMQAKPAIDPERIALLQDAITAKSRGGSYNASNATNLKIQVEQILPLLTGDSQ